MSHMVQYLNPVSHHESSEEGLPIISPSLGILCPPSLHFHPTQRLKIYTPDLMLKTPLPNTTQFRDMSTS